MDELSLTKWLWWLLKLFLVQPILHGAVDPCEKPCTIVSDDQVLYRNQLQTRNQTSRVEDELTSRPNSTETMDIPLRTLPTLSSGGVSRVR
uniref:Uncharacterized protein n=1 Tax=Ditylenchus dipsaci TaxID=166011 RepID=A0A915DUP6_9BILA